MARVTLVQQIQSVELRQTVFQVVVSLTGPVASGPGTGPGGPVEWTAIQNKPTEFPPASHGHPIADVTGLSAALDGKQDDLGFTPEDAAQKGVAGGYAGLDGSGQVPAAQLPAPGNSDTIVEGTGNLYFTEPRVRATTLAGYAMAGVYSAIAAGDSILIAFGKIGRRLADLAAVAFSGSASDLTAGTLPAARFDDTAHGARAGGALHPAATGSVAGFMAATDKTKLDGVATGATANATDAALRDRATHTGTQDAATITGSKTSSFISDFAAAVAALITGKQNTLVSGTNIRTVNGNSLLGSGDLVVGGGVTDGDKGDITVSGTGAAWTIDAGAVSLSKMADLATSTILGRATAGTGAPEALTAAQVRTILNVANGATANSPDATLLNRANHTGTQAAATITGLSALATSSDAANLTGTLAAARIADGSLPLGKVASIAASTILGNNGGSPAAPIALTLAQVRTLLNVADGANNYSHPNHTGDVTSTGDGATVIAPAAISGKPLVTAEGADHVLILDATDGALKKALLSDLGGGGGGSPAGSSGEIQFNNAGAFGGAADVEIEGGQLRLPAIATPAAPAADGIKVYGKKYGETTMPFFKSGSDVEEWTLQPMIAEGGFFALLPATGTAFTAIACPAYSLTGTAAQEASTVGSRRARVRRTRVNITTAATTAVAGVRVNAILPLTVNGGLDWEGGFLGVMHGGPSTGVANASHRFFMGLHDSGAPTDVNPSTLPRMCGIGYDSADTQVQFMHNDTSGAATKIPLGVDFPKPSVDGTDLYRLRMFAPPGTTRQLRYEVTNLVNRAVVVGTVTTDLPAVTDLLVPKLYTSVGGVSAVTGVAVGPVSFQTEPY